MDATATRKIIESIIENESAVRLGSACVVGYVPASKPAYDRLTKGKTPKSGRTPLGIVVKESMARHPDALSVTGGIWQHSTDSDAPSQRWVWVLAGEDGEPDVDHLCRTDGPVSKMMAGM